MKAHPNLLVLAVSSLRGRGCQIATAVVAVLLASVEWPRNANAADVSGRIGAGGVSALAIDPHTPTTLYAAAECGGVLKSTNGGDNWIVANTGLTALPAFAFAIDPLTPNTIYAGTSGGVFESTDAGATWTARNNGIDGFINTLAIDPSNPDTIYAAGTSTCISESCNVTAVFKSTGGATSWQAAGLSDLSGSGFGTLVIDPITPDTLYAGGYGLFKTTNGGGAWRATGLAGPAISGDALRCGAEECDDGNTVSGDGCDANFRVTACGNGVVTAGEQCDNGTANSFDGCTDACTLCGDGMPCTDDDPGRTAASRTTQSPSGPTLRPRFSGGPSDIMPLPSAFTLHLTTGTVAAEILNANANADQRIADGEPCGGSACVATTAGEPFSCETDTPRFVETELVAAMPVLDTPSLGDLVATFAMSPTPSVCAGDCHGDGRVTVDELVTLVTMALGDGTVSECDSGDVNDDLRITVDDIIAAVTVALGGCL